MIIKAVLPTRGLIYAKTIQGLLENIHPQNIVISSGLPMPNCFNDGIRSALDLGADYIWMVEEDNELPRGVLSELLRVAEQGNPIVTMDYTVGGGNSHVYKIDGKIAWCGLGCTLINRKVFDSIPEPWFEVDKHLDFKGDDFELRDIPKENVGKSWGGHDSLFFYIKAKQFPITVLEGWHGEHYRCEEMPKIEKNNGHYKIYSL